MKDSIKNLRGDTVAHLHSYDRCKRCKLSDIEDYKEFVLTYYFGSETLILSLWF